MADWFEDFMKTLADDTLTRRQAVGRIAGVAAGATLAAWLPEQALAKHIPWKKQCFLIQGGTCDGSFRNCNNPNFNCFCFIGLRSAEATFCGCNSYCSQVSTCLKQSDCPRGTVCSTLNGCTACGNSYGVCIPMCKGKRKNCTFGSGHGMTAIGRVV